MTQANSWIASACMLLIGLTGCKINHTQTTYDCVQPATKDFILQCIASTKTGVALNQSWTDDGTPVGCWKVARHLYCKDKFIATYYEE